MVISFDQALEDGGEEIIFAKVFVVRKLLEKYAGMVYISGFGQMTVSRLSRGFAHHARSGYTVNKPTSNHRRTDIRCDNVQIAA